MTVWTREAIKLLKEDDFSREVLAPLFEAMGYRDVRFHGGGVLEQGKDIIMYSEEPVRGRVNTAVVVKSQPITGKIITGEVVNQLREAFGKRYLDTATARELQIHQCFVVTPEAISKEGTFTLEGLVNKEPFRDQVAFIDGSRLWEYIEKYLGSRILLPRLAETFRKLQEVAPNVGIELKGNTLTLKRADQPAVEAAIVTPSFTDTPEGLAHRGAFERFLKTGEPAELPASSFQGLPVPAFVQALGIDFTSGLVRVGGHGRPLIGSLTLRAANSESVTFEHIEFVGRGGSEQLYLTNEAQGIPFTMCMTVTMTSDGRAVMNMDYSSKMEGWSAHWLDKQQKALQVMARGCTIVFKEERTGIEYAFGAAPAGLVETSSAPFQELVRQLAWVEQQLQQPILVPSRPFFTTQDREDLDFVRNVIDTGQVPVNSSQFTIVPVPARRELLIQALKKGSGEGLISGESSFWSVLGTQVALGPIELRGTGARLRPTLPLLDSIAAIERGDDVEVIIEPGKGKRLDVRYLWWWYKRKSRR